MSIAPEEAREAVLDALPAKDQARVARRAAKQGPLKDDADWLVAYAAERCAARIETAVAAFETRIEVLVADAVAKAALKDAVRPAVASRAALRDLLVFVVALGVFAGVALYGSRSPRVPLAALAAFEIALGAGAAMLYVRVAGLRR